MSEFDNFLFDSNESRSGRSRRRRDRNKERAEAQFDVTAAPVKLNVFMEDLMNNKVDIPAIDADLDFNSVEAPMEIEVPVYNTDCAEYSAQILEYSNDLLCELDEEQQIEEESRFQDSSLNSMLPSAVEFKSVIKNVENEVMATRKKYKELTAKRMTLKALQLFSFSQHYDKHFNMDKNELRSLNVDMMIDRSENSKLFLRNVGVNYFERYQKLFHYGDPPRSLTKLTPDDPRFRTLGYSYILANTTISMLQHPNQYLTNSNNPEFAYSRVTFNMILKYFGFKFFDYHEGLVMQLTHLSVINMYYNVKKKFFLDDLFGSWKRKKETKEYSLDPKRLNVLIEQIDHVIED